MGPPRAVRGNAGCVRLTPQPAAPVSHGTARLFLTPPRRAARELVFLSRDELTMNQTIDFSGRLRRAMGPALLAVLPILVKLPLILGLLKADPLLLWPGL